MAQGDDINTAKPGINPKRKKKRTPKRDGPLPEITDKQLREYLKEQGGK